MDYVLTGMRKTNSGCFACRLGLLLSDNPTYCAAATESHGQDNGPSLLSLPFNTNKATNIKLALDCGRTTGSVVDAYFFSTCGNLKEHHLCKERIPPSITFAYLKMTLFWTRRACTFTSPRGYFCSLRCRFGTKQICGSDKYIYCKSSSGR